MKVRRYVDEMVDHGEDVPAAAPGARRGRDEDDGADDNEDVSRDAHATPRADQPSWWDL